MSHQRTPPGPLVPLPVLPSLRGAGRRLRHALRLPSTRRAERRAAELEALEGRTGLELSGVLERLAALSADLEELREFPPLPPALVGVRGWTAAGEACGTFALLEPGRESRTVLYAPERLEGCRPWCAWPAPRVLRGGDLAALEVLEVPPVVVVQFTVMGRNLIRGSGGPFAAEGVPLVAGLELDGGELAPSAPAEAVFRWPAMGGPVGGSPRAR